MCIDEFKWKQYTFNAVLWIQRYVCCFFFEKLEMMEKICVECAMWLNIQNKQFNSFRFEILTLVILNVIAYIKIHKWK